MKLSNDFSGVFGSGSSEDETSSCEGAWRSPRADTPLNLFRETRRHVLLPKVYPWGRRRVVAAGENFTCARIPEHAHEEHCLGRFDGSSAWAQDMRACTADHAFRRVMITYLQFVAYWDEGLTVDRGQTCDQSGTASCPYRVCEAAHSALLPNLADNWPQRFAEKVRNRGLNPQLMQQLYVLGVSADKLYAARGMNPRDVTAHWLFDELSAEERTHLLALSTHLYHASNSTVELPYVVNRVDSALEGAMRSRAVELLSAVSSGKLHPYEALGILVDEMRAFFRHSLVEIREKIEIYRLIYDAERILCRMDQFLQNPGDSDPARLVSEYCQRLRSLRDLVQRSEGLNRHSPTVKTTQLLTHRRNQLRLAEDYATSLHRKISRMRSQQLRSFTQHLIERTSDLHPDPHPLSHCQNLNVKDLRRQVRAYVNSMDIITLLTRDPEALQHTYTKLRLSARKQSPADEQAWTTLLNYLDNCAIVTNIQCQASALPPRELLSGVYDGNKRRPMNDEEMHAQQLDIWAKRYDIEYV